MDEDDDGRKPRAEQLFHDHEQASEEARYRDRLLYNTYYLATIVLFLVGQSALTVITNNRTDLLPIVLFSGSIIYFLLTAWATGVRESRNNAWARREKIESLFRNLRTNEYTKLATGPNKRSRSDTLSEGVSKEIRNIRSFSDLSNVIALIDPDLVTWFLFPASFLLFVLGVITSIPHLPFEIMIT